MSALPGALASRGAAHSRPLGTTSCPPGCSSLRAGGLRAPQAGLVQRAASHSRSSVSDRSRINAASTVDDVKTDKDAASTSNEVVKEAVMMPGLPVHRELGPPPAVGRMCKKDRAFVEEHRIRGYEAGPDRKATILTVANLMQEAGSNHAVSLYGRTDSGFAAAPDMLEKGLIFAMTRMQIQVDEYPSWGDVVEAETWFQANGRISINREWTVTNVVTDKQIGRGTSMWVMINMNTRRPSKIPPEMRLVIDNFGSEHNRFALDTSETGIKIPELAEPYEIVGPVQVSRRSDMDMNGHINNVTYLAWTLETVPEELFTNGHLYQMEIDYKHECTAGNTVESLAAKVPEAEVTYSNGGRKVVQYVHMLRRCDEDGCTELVRARTTWLL